MSQVEKLVTESKGWDGWELEWSVYWVGPAQAY